MTDLPDLVIWEAEKRIELVLTRYVTDKLVLRINAVVKVVSRCLGVTIKRVAAGSAVSNK